jgi:ABC-type lipoprotein export system ATPase subunit
MIRTVDLTKIYKRGKEVRAVDGVTISVETGEFVLVIGRSGSGKTTLLSMIGGLTRPTSGLVELWDRNVWLESDKELSNLRARRIGFVFQFSGLMPTLTALENVMLPGLFAGTKSGEAERASALIEDVGLSGRGSSYPSQMSAGEMKRVAIARSLMNEPDLILADEPTGDLDVDTEREIMGVFKRMNDEGKTVLMVTHSPELSVHADRVLRMEKGKIQEVPPP